MKKQKNFKSLVLSLLAFAFVFSLAFTSCGGKKESESSEDTTEHPSGEHAEHPSDSEGEHEHPSEAEGEHPSSDSTEHPSN